MCYSHCPYTRIAPVDYGGGECELKSDQVIPEDAWCWEPEEEEDEQRIYQPVLQDRLRRL